MDTDHSPNGFSDWLAEYCINYRRTIFVAIMVVTLIFGYFAVQIDVQTKLDDLLPDHKFMEVQREFGENFGGANVVSILLEVEGEGTIFERPVLQKIKTITRDLREVKGVNTGTIKSLAAKQIQEIESTARQIKMSPVMWPDVPKSEDAVQKLRRKVQSNPRVYGVYVSTDLKAARITTGFYPDLLDPVTAFDQVRGLLDNVDDESVNVSVVGNPILYGWVNYYLPQTLTIVVVSFVLIGLALVVFTGTFLGALIALLTTIVSASWALGFTQIIDLHFDPLVVVIAFLIIARVVSASVQSIMRFKRELRSGVTDSVLAAKRTLAAKWTPGALAVVTDAGAFLIVYLTPIPILQKIAFTGFIWLITIPVTAIILTTVSLSFVGDVENNSLMPFSVESILNPISDAVIRLTRTQWSYVILVGTLAILLVAGYFATGITVGNAKAGSSILWPDSTYNQSVKKLNRHFLGSNQMFVVFSGEDSKALQKPTLLKTMAEFQRFMEHQKEIGGSLSLADVLPAINRTLHGGDPRFLRLGNTSALNGQLLYFFQDSPAALKGLSDKVLKNGAVTLFFTDRRGKTVRKSVDRIQAFKHRIEEEDQLEGAEMKLAGGPIGVLSATNEVIRSTELQSIALALLLALILCALTYFSPLAGLYLIVPLLVANAITYGYMAWANIGLNINSVPVAALGIGLGIDYAIYVADRIRSGYEEKGSLEEAIPRAIYGAGQSVMITVFVLAISIVPFLFSSLRFQAEMALLIALWMAVAAIGAILVIPSLVIVFRPHFILKGD